MGEPAIVIHGTQVYPKKKPYTAPKLTIKKRYVKPEVEVKTTRKGPIQHERQNTERGHSPELTRALKTIEEKTRNLKDEQANYYDENGKLIHHIQGKGAEVRHSFLDSMIIKAAKQQGRKVIMTHNHPRGIKKDKFGNIGHSFSSKDILTEAFSYDVDEFRAATPTFTFSIKRPANGWGSKSKFESVYKRISKELQKEAFDHDGKRNMYQQKRKGSRTYYLSDRTDVWYFNELNRRVAKEMGWDYTRSQQHKTKGWSKKK